MLDARTGARDTRVSNMARVGEGVDTARMARDTARVTRAARMTRTVRMTRHTAPARKAGTL